MQPTSSLAESAVRISLERLRSCLPAGEGAPRPEAGFKALAKQPVLLEEPIPMGSGAADDLLWLRILREITSHNVRLDWTLGGEPFTAFEDHVHLFPPSDGVGPAASELARRWKAGYRYGMYYYRRGPGFVTVKDVRTGADASRLVIGEGFEHFLRMGDVSRVDDLSGEAQAAVQAAADAGLVLEAEGRLLLLPYRMRHWPVPYVGA